MSWPVVRRTGRAGELHGLELPTRRCVWVLEAARPAVVLGSTQDAAILDADAVRSAGFEVARRRSGGGLVLVGPRECTWVDVSLPAGDPLWHDDVGRSFGFVGRAWQQALDRRGVASTVHEPPLDRTPWSALVCMAGRGPGEVSVDGRKVIGMSQRRERTGARFQCALLRRWQPEVVASLLATPDPAPRSQLAAAAAPLDVDHEDLVEGFAAALDTGC